MNKELIQLLSLPTHEARLRGLALVLANHKETSSFTDASAKEIVQLLQQQGLNSVKAIEKCMYICELIAQLDLDQALFLMIQLYVCSMGEFVHHIWDAVELYLFENPRQSAIDYLDFLLVDESDLSVRGLYQEWIDGLGRELQNTTV